MSEWKTYKLDGVMSRIGDGLHGTPEYDDNGEYYFVNGSNLVDGKICASKGIKKVSSDEYKKYKKDLSEKTILLGINGTIGNVALYRNEKCILGKSAAYLNVNNNFDRAFMRYMLQNTHFQNYIATNASGTTIKNVGLSLLRQYEFNAPSDIKEQIRIASILSSLDDKIELNLQMNKTLETMTQAIFKEWFVDLNFPGFDGELINGLPRGWRMGKVSDTCKVNVNTLTPKDKITEIKYIEISEVDKGTVKNIATYKRGEEPSRARRKLLHGDIALSTVRPDRGSYFLSLNPENNLIASTGFAVFTATSVPFSFLYCFLTNNEQIEYYGRMADGAAYPAISPSVIMNIDLIIPSDDILALFNSAIEKLYIKLHENLNENKTLTQLRDSLLPKLMTGKIEVHV